MASIYTADRNVWAYAQHAMATALHGYLLRQIDPDARLGSGFVVAGEYNGGYAVHHLTAAGAAYNGHYTDDADDAAAEYLRRVG